MKPIVDNLDLSAEIAKKTQGCFFTAGTCRQQPFNLAADAAAKDVTIISFLTGIATGTTANRNAAKTSPE